MTLVFQALAALYLFFGLVCVIVFLSVKWRDAVLKGERKRLLKFSIIIFAIWPIVAVNEIVVAVQSQRKGKGKRDG